jgi:4-amino-4-deoxy-L-arabinose transferase-like glycosyltransferase
MSFRRHLSRPFLIVVALWLAFAAFSQLDHRKLANPDEGRYSTISHEMAQSGDFITPRLNGLKYFEKPPMQYWATAIAFKLFGENEFSARLYTFLAGMACIALIAYTGRRLFDPETGALAALTLLAAPYFMMLSEIVTLDMGLTFWMTLGVCSFLIAQRTSNAASERKWMLLAWAGMAGAVLSKGLIGIVFPAAAIFLYCVIARDFRLLLRLHWGLGLVVFFAISAPWFILVSRENPEFARFFFIHEHWERFTSTTHRREGAWWTFFPILFAGFMPWAVALIPSWISGWRTRPEVSLTSENYGRKPFAPLKFILIFSAFILLFFSKSGSKLPAYILPFFPVLALVLGYYLKNTSSKALSWFVLPTVPLMCIAAYAAWQEPMRRDQFDFAHPLYEAMSAWAVAGALTIAAAALVAFFALRKDFKWFAVSIISLSVLIGIELFERGYEKISPLQSGYAVSQSIAKYLMPETRLYTIKTYDQSAPFYLKRTFTMVEYIDEFELGQQQEPQKYIAEISDFIHAWNAPGPAIAIIQPKGGDELKALGIKFETIHQDPRRAAIRKIP